MKLTRDQQTAVDHRGSDMLVAASAGSGKTAVLTRRCVSLLLDPQAPCDVSRLLVVTFTRAAAAELRVRIAEELRRAAAKLEDSRLARHALRQELLLESAEIGTIDAWCGRLVRTHYDVLGIDPAFAMLAPEAADVLRRRVMDELFEWVFTADQSPAAQARDWLLRHNRPSDDLLRQMVAGLNRFREQLVNPQVWLQRQRQACEQDDRQARAAAGALLAAALAEDLQTHLRQTRALSADLKDPHALEQLTDYIGNLERWRDRLAAAAAPGEALEDVVAEIGAYRFRKLPPGVDERQKARLAEVRERWFRQDLLSTWEADQVRAMLARAPQARRLAGVLLALEEQFHERLWQAKTRQRVLEFADVLALALDLLGDPDGPASRRPTPAALALRQRYEHVLVDEYQDTSPAQVELLRLASREPARGNRFLVGDLKQSIYGFRRAEPRLFAEQAAALRRADAPGRLHALCDNFRTSQRLLNTLNAIFERLFAPELGGLDYDDSARLRAARPEDALANPTLDALQRLCVQLVVPLEPPDTSDPDDPQQAVPLERMQREARVVADCLREMLGRGTQIPHRRPDGSLELKPLEFSDVAVLIRAAAGNADVLADALRRLGVPCVVAGREALLDSREALDVRCVLGLLINSQQDVALAAFLRGPLVRLSAQDLLDIREATPRGGLMAAVQAYLAAPGDARVCQALRAALELLERWRAFARWEDPGALVRRIIREGGLDTWVLGLRAGAQRLARLQALEELAAQFAAGGRGGLAELVEHLDQLQEQELAPAISPPAGEPAVRIMTIHASKGLEFPVVFLVNAGARFRFSAGSLACDESAGIGVRWFDLPARAVVRSAAHFCAQAQRRRRERDEELRLLYVAATRARERLIIVGHAQADTWQNCCTQFGGAPVPLLSRLKAASMLDWVLMALASCGAGEAAQAQALSVEVRTIPVSTRAPPAAEPIFHEPEIAAALDEADERWLQQARDLIEAPLDLTATRLPGVVSASLVRRPLDARGPEDATARLGPSAVPALPRFAQAGGAKDESGALEAGAAAHRFLQHCDLGDLTSEWGVLRQISLLQRDGRLTAEQAALLAPADLSWLGASRVGALLRDGAQHCHRELPFVFGLPLPGRSERILLRGVIDCLIERDDGLWLIDYKATLPRDPARAAAQREAHRLQLQLYAQAAAALLGRPVREALLVYLKDRCIEPVDLAQDASARLLEILEVSAAPGGGEAAAAAI